MKYFFECEESFLKRVDFPEAGIDMGTRTKRFFLSGEEDMGFWVSFEVVAVLDFYVGFWMGFWIFSLRNLVIYELFMSW